MSLPLPRAMLDREPLVLRLGPAINFAAQEAALERELLEAFMSDDLQRQYDPWFTVEPPEKKQPKKKVVVRKLPVKRRQSDDGDDEAEDTRFAFEEPLELHVGQRAWIWAPISTPGPYGNGMYPYAGTVKAVDVATKTCDFHSDDGIFSPGVQWSRVAVKEPKPKEHHEQ